MYLQVFGNRVKFYRYRFGLTQKELAKTLSIDESTVISYEKGTHIPYDKQRQKFDLFEVANLISAGDMK